MCIKARYSISQVQLIKDCGNDAEMVVVKHFPMLKVTMHFVLGLIKSKCVWYVSPRWIITKSHFGSKIYYLHRNWHSIKLIRTY